MAAFPLCRYNSIKLVNTIFLVVTIVIFFGYAVFLLRPYKAKVEREACRLAGLLSHVPAEMDVAAHARQVVRAYGRLRAGGSKTPAAGTGSARIAADPDAVSSLMPKSSGSATGA